MGAAEVLDIQASMLDRLKTGGPFAQMIVKQASIRNDGTMMSPEYGASVVRDMITMLSMAETYHVSADMTPQITWAASQLDDTDQFTREMAPSEFGFVRFESPLIMYDSRNKIMKVNLLLWGPLLVEEGGRVRTITNFFYYNDMNDPDDYGEELLGDYQREYLASYFNRYLYSGFEYGEERMRMGPPMLDTDKRYAALLRAEGVKPSEHTNMLRQFYALWLLMQQTIARRDDADIPRPFARRAKRMGIPPRVSVIHLRHESETTEGLGETNVRWSHRWIVRGKWQWRACRQDHPYAQPYEKGWHCRVWIASYEKGPRHLPLIQTTKVYSLDR